MPLLSVQGLAVDFATMDGVVHAVEGVDLEIAAGETVAIVGESGFGQVHDRDGDHRAARRRRARSPPAASASTAGRSRMRPENELRTIRGRDIGLVPQDPMSNLNPVAKIGTQVAETLLAHGLANRQNVQEKVVEALDAAGLPDAASACEAVSARVLRWHAPARAHRDRSGVQAAPADRRRADQRARRHGAAARSSTRSAR